MEQALLVMTTMPDMESARTIARNLVEARLAACVNVIGGMHAIYRWQEQIEESTEIALHIKTTVGKYAQLEKAIAIAHPYEMPEIVAIKIEQGSAPYLHWIAEQTKASQQA